ncbi:sensor histidine kinase [Actinoalloteichus spitiensis]|uniref:sensor histidine kinase n=1 Tax=Actinoalloteichus spitiensis TaxID=252394 RepID=UPI000370D0F1|nr:HAMP domain-containing sensor histidine kinase [Actinoalloteichus spitiensis]
MTTPRDWSLGLRTRIAASIVLLTVAASAGVGFASYRVQADDSTERFVLAADASFQSTINHLRTEEELYGEGRVAVLAEEMDRWAGVGWSAVDLGSPPVSWPPAEGEPSGGVYSATAGDPQHRDAPVPAELVREAVVGAAPAVQRDPHRSGWLLVAGEVTPGLVLVQHYGMHRLDVELSRLRHQLAAISAVVAFLATVAAILAANQVSRPLRTAAEAARRFGEGDLGTRLPVAGRDDLADLATAFNAMAERLSHSITDLRAKDEQQRRFVSDVTHDLRTPLASMVAAADSLNSMDGASRARAAELLAVQSRRLARLVEDLLEISRFDAGAVEVLREPVDLAELVGDAVALAAPDVDTSVRVVGDVLVTGDARRLHTIVRNLLTNAVTHGAEPVAVTVDGTDSGTVLVRVADSGPGVPEDLVPIVFDRFVRGDSSRRVTEGSGLGLSIAAQNTVAHGGHLAVHNAGGAVFTVTLPRGEPPPTSRGDDEA